MSEPATFEEWEKRQPHHYEYASVVFDLKRAWEAGRRAGLEEAAAHSEDTGHKRDPAMLAEEIRALKDRGPSDE